MSFLSFFKKKIYSSKLYFYFNPIQPNYFDLKIENKFVGNDFLIDLLCSRKPFFFGRFGETETRCLYRQLANEKSLIGILRYPKSFKYDLWHNAGFFQILF